MLDDCELAVEGPRLHLLAALCLPFFDVPGGHFREQGVAKALCESSQDVLLIVPRSLVAGGELIVPLGEFREGDRLARLFEVEAALHDLTHPRFECFLRDVLAEAGRFTADALFDVPAVELVANIVGDVSVFPLALLAPQPGEDPLLGSFD